MENTKENSPDIDKVPAEETAEKIEDTRAFVAPCRKVGLDAPLRWLKLGWRDFRRIPRLSFGYGLVMTAISALIIVIAWSAHSFVLAIALIGGFFSIAIGLYSMSRQLENGITPVLMRCIREGRKNFGNEMILAFVFLIIFLIWARAASMVHIFLPSFGAATPADLIMFLSIGSAVGAVFAAVVFCVGAFSIPMMMDRNVDAITAVITSVSATQQNHHVVVGFNGGCGYCNRNSSRLYWPGDYPAGYWSCHLVCLPGEVIDADAWERNPGIKTD